MARSQAIDSVFALSFEGRLSEEIRTAGAEVHIIGAVRASRPLSVLRARSCLSALLSQTSFDATMVHSPWALSLLANRHCRPLVFYQHDIFRGEHWTEKLARHTHPDLILANSAHTARSTFKLFPGKHVQVIHPPADLSLAPSPKSKEPAVILIASRFESWKGHALLLEALALLQHIPGWTLSVAGQPQTASERELYRSLRLTAAKLGLEPRVSFLGHISDIPALMQTAHIYCQPNTAPEPFGLAFVEALACGLAVVTTPLGGVREILEPAWGLLALPDPAAIAAAIQRLLLDPGLRRRLGELGPARARALCDPQSQIHAIARSMEPLFKKKAA
jgi:glycosyltransferase involved in cell wall biosynthesis